MRAADLPPPARGPARSAPGPPPPAARGPPAAAGPKARRARGAARAGRGAALRCLPPRQDIDRVTGPRGGEEEQERPGTEKGRFQRYNFPPRLFFPPSPTPSGLRWPRAVTRLSSRASDGGGGAIAARSYSQDPCGGIG